MGIKSPVVLRKTLEDYVSNLREKHADEVRRLQHNHQGELERERRELRDVVNRLINVAIVHDERGWGRCWRVVTELEPEMIVRALERGNDNAMIQQIATEVGYMVERELRACNIQRPESLRMGRG